MATICLEKRWVINNNMICDNNNELNYRLKPRPINENL